MKAQFCSQCGAAAETREVDGRVREVCTRCGTVFYRNPLPVAAAVVLNAAREVLLIRRKREPGQGLWGLPMGFAELDETITHAAIRELHEETGLKGRPLRLLAAESTRVEPYGDLLVITFEVEKTGGQEKAGDDADALDYFPIHQLPPLAFAANQRAIRHCAQAHREPWAIQDSFRHVNAEPREALLSDALVRMISREADGIVEAWLREVRHLAHMPGYARVEPERLRERAAHALSQFSDWLVSDHGHEEVVRFYQALGAERRAQGIELAEVLSSLACLRRQILLHAMQQGVWKGALDAYRVLELDHRIMRFFDEALYHTARGYHAATP
jgi:8-oxo-dGTP diphosphatase